MFGMTVVVVEIVKDGWLQFVDALEDAVSDALSGAFSGEVGAVRRQKTRSRKGIESVLRFQRSGIRSGDLGKSRSTMLSKKPELGVKCR
jgi:hypothetical protein